MKNLILAACLSLAIAGCSTGPVDQGTIDATAVLLRNAARTGCIVATQPPNGEPGNSAYFDLAAAAIGTFITQTNYTPGAFQEALMRVDGAALTNQWVQIGVGTLVDLYQLYWSSYIRGQVNGNAYAGVFLGTIQDGFNQCAGRPSAQPAGLASRNAAPKLILPRPIKK
jgi:hypothetical protein